MKNHTLHFALALGLLLGGLGKAVAQQLFASAPIIVCLSEIDRYSVNEWSSPKAMDGARLGFLYRDNIKQSEVDRLVIDGAILNRSVWIMDGARVIAKCSLFGEYMDGARVFTKCSSFGEYRAQLEPNLEARYGLCLSFGSDEEAQKICSIVKLYPSVDELIRQHKSQLSDARFWIP